MMEPETLHRKLYAVAGRFHFSSTELWSMELSRLNFWYDGHAAMNKEEKELANGKEL